MTSWPLINRLWLFQIVHQVPAVQVRTWQRQNPEVRPDDPEKDRGGKSGGSSSRHRQREQQQQHQQRERER